MANPQQHSTTTPPWESKGSRRGKGMLRRVLMWLLLAGLLGWIVWGFRPKPIEVEIDRAGYGPLTVHVVEEGKTRVRNRYMLSTPVAGHMRRVVAKAGDEVKAGESILTVIEPAVSPLLDPRAEAQARARVEIREAACQQAAESLEMVSTAAKFAESHWQRMRQLGESGGVSATDKDNAERDHLMRQREVHASRFAVQVANHELAQAKAALAQAEGGGSELAVALRSPVSGRVLKVLQESAAVLAQGTPIMESGDPADIEIEAEILSRDAVAIRSGAPVSIEQWGGATPLAGRVRRVEPAAFTKISSLGVEEQRVIVLSDMIDPPGDARFLGDRYRVEVRVAIWHADKVLQVPSGALFREGNIWKTFTVVNGVARKTTVEVGKTDGRHTEISGGIAEGTEVLVHPPDAIKDGSAVVPRATTGN